MREPFQSELWAARYDLLRQSKGAILVALMLLAALAAMTFWQVRVSNHPVEIIDAEVLRFGSYADYDGNHPLVIVRLPNGQTRQLPASPHTLRSCRDGSKVSLVRQAGSLRVAFSGCAEQT